MIEPTSEMRLAFDEAPKADHGCHCAVCLNHRLAAVFALVDRDYDVTPRAPDVEHRMLGDGAHWNAANGEYDAECTCGETFSAWGEDAAVESLLNHMERPS